MIMWHISLSRFVSVVHTMCSSFQTIFLKSPGYVSSLHTAIYLPTAGNDSSFTSILAQLKDHIEDMQLQYPNTPHFIRGDANSNPKNKPRTALYDHFCRILSLKAIRINHPIYHHFTGKGAFDSERVVLSALMKLFVNLILPSLTLIMMY